MIKVVVLFLLLLSFFIYPEEDDSVIEKKISDSLSVSKYTRDIGIGLLTPGYIFSLASIPLFAYYNYAENSSYRSYNDITHSYENYNSFNSNEILSMGISSISCGMFLNFSAAALFILSKIYQDKGDLLLNQLPEDKRQNIEKNLPSHLKKWSLQKKLAITGTLLIIYGSLSITGGIVELIAMNLIKLDFLNNHKKMKEYYDKNNLHGYQERDIDTEIGKQQNIASISALITIGSILEISGIFFLLHHLLKKIEKCCIRNMI